MQQLSLLSGPPKRWKLLVANHNAGMQQLSLLSDKPPKRWKSLPPLPSRMQALIRLRNPSRSNGGATEPVHGWSMRQGVASLRLEED